VLGSVNPPLGLARVTANPPVAVDPSFLAKSAPPSHLRCFCHHPSPFASPSFGHLPPPSDVARRGGGLWGLVAKKASAALASFTLLPPRAACLKIPEISHAIAIPVCRLLWCLKVSSKSHDHRKVVSCCPVMPNKISCHLNSCYHVSNAK
jgi:hypothetical protein